MSIKLNLNIQQANLVVEALEEYENRHYESESDAWQVVINELITNVQDEIYDYQVFKAVKERQSDEKLH